MTRSIKNLVAAVLIAISAYLLLTEIWPSRTLISVLKDRIEEKTVLLTLRNEMLARIMEIKKEKDDASAGFQRLALVLPEKDNLPEVITAVESIFSQSGVVLPGLVVAKGKSVKGIGSISLEVGSTATYQQFISLLSYLETNLRLFDIEKIAVGLSRESIESKSGGQGLDLDFSIAGQFYWIDRSSLASTREENTILDPSDN